MNLVRATHQLSTDFPPGCKVSLDKCSIRTGEVGVVVGYRILHLREKPPEMRLSVDVPGDHWVLSPNEVDRIEDEND